VLGGVLVWLFYKNHYDATDDEAAKLGTFCTAPAIRNYGMNFLSEFIATFALVFIIISFSTKGNGCDMSHYKFGLAALGPIPVTLLIIALGMSLGGTTGYAMILPVTSHPVSHTPSAWVARTIGHTLGFLFSVDHRRCCRRCLRSLVTHTLMKLLLIN
jgi:glycerol uptake facilitator-like aquaporin